MYFDLADPHRAGDSPIHRLDPRVKVVLALLFILTVSLTPFAAFGTYGLLWAVVMAAVLLAHVGPGYVVRRSMVALPFALAAVTLPFTIPGEPLWVLPLWGGLTLSVEGTARFVSILVKSWISVQMAILLVTVTPFSDLLWGLRALHVPQPLIAIVGFMYRYLFVLADEVLRMVRARAARSATLPGRRSGGSLWWRGKVAGRMAGSLMIRSFERSERIYSAMLARGYRGEMHVLAPPRLERADFIVLAGAIGLLAMILLGSYH
jgi:cobalt/nickel transport system permease protein